MLDVQTYAGKASQKRLSDRGQKARHDDIRAADCQIPGVGVGKELDLFQALPHFIEYGHSALEERASIGRELHTLRIAVKQPHAERMLQVRDRLGNDRMRNRKMRGGLRHAARFRHREYYMEVSEPDAAADAIGPIHDLGLSL